MIIFYEEFLYFIFHLFNFKLKFIIFILKSLIKLRLESLYFDLMNLKQLINLVIFILQLMIKLILFTNKVLNLFILRFYFKRLFWLLGSNKYLFLRIEQVKCSQQTKFDLALEWLKINKYLYFLHFYLVLCF